MPRFLLHRLQRLSQNPSAEKITLGLEAASYLHWVTTYETDPARFAAVEERLPELRRLIADYFAITARETEAHLELMTSEQPDGHDTRATRDSQTPTAHTLPAQPGPALLGQFGLNWVLLYWDAVKDGGQPWAYRVYRTDKKSAPVLVATVTECEALLPSQPERVKLHYYVTAFNAAGEGPRTGEFALTLNAPDEVEEAADLPSQSSPAPQPEIPEHEMPIRRELGTAMMDFMRKLMNTRLGQGEEDEVMRQVVTEEYRQAVLKAARQNIEVSLSWHTLATWTEDGNERIGYFARALECLRAETAASPPQTAHQRWTATHTEASCLFEIGRVHFHEESPDAARRFLTEALPLARQADALRAEAKVDDDHLEGQIAELLLQLPDEEGGEDGGVKEEMDC